jgi:hypothetical protein
MILNLTETLLTLSPKAFEIMGQEHLEFSKYKILGYWDEDEQYYEEIVFKQPCFAKFLNFSLIENGVDNYWIKLKFQIQSQLNTNNFNSKIGELILILDQNFKYIDENWLIDVNSPFVVAKL